jgi:hypothetical protein
VRRPFYTSIHINFLKKIIVGRSYKEVVRLFNERFKLSATESAVKTLLTRNGIRNDRGRGIQRERKYLDKHLDYLKKIVPGTPYKIVLEKFNNRFGFSISLQALRSLCKKYQIQNGFLGYFPKGHIPFNKGRKGYCAPGSEKGWFKPGHAPVNTMPIGSKRINADGYVEIKYSNSPGSPKHRWKGKHVMVWEKANGPVPEGHAVIFADGNNRNFNLGNLMLVSRAELLVMNKNGLISRHKDLTMAGKTVAEIKLQIAAKKRKSIKSSKRKLVIIDNNDWKVVIVRTSKGHYAPARKYEWGLQLLWVKECPPRKTIEKAEEDLKVYALKRGWQRL